jgi:hypothetical protein
LSGEIHVALLKLIIKDIEDVARTPSTGLGMNQNGAANPGGGHPHIVEGVTSALCTLEFVICLPYYFFLIVAEPFLNLFIIIYLCYFCIRHMHGALIYGTGSGT